MLEELAKKDSKWRSYALWLTKDKAVADDLVQDMYLKFYNLDKKQIEDFFVIISIRNAFYDAQKKKAYESRYEDLSMFSGNDNEYEPDDKDNEIINYIKNNCAWWEIELLEMKSEHSLRELAERYNINYGFIYKTLKRIKDEVKNKYNGKTKRK